MISNDDIVGICGYLKSTPEGALRKMMVEGAMTDVHFRLLVKLAKGSNESEFASAFNAENFGKIKLQTAELKIREAFWPVCKSKLSQMGLLHLTKAKEVKTAA